MVVLALRVRDQNERYARLYDRATRPYAGMWVPTFRAATLAGDSVTIGETPEGRRQVLFFFTTICPYCKSSLPAWKELAATLDTLTTPKVEVYGVSLDSVDVTREYAVEHELPYPVLFFPEEKLSRIYRAGTVPLTAVLDEQGRMVHARLGEISERASIDSVVAMVKWRAEPRPSAPPAEAAHGS
ncbi:MAG: TlpA family protein disulfide reductase [Gemmatimonadota bacterium]|nr:TlpA family protein disulfide reductase [Gemmatimonadota bacterium]